MIDVPHAIHLHERRGPPGGLTRSKAYSSEVAARRAIEALRAAGVPARDIRLLTGTGLRDIRREPVGGFAGPVAPDAPIGTYGDRQVLRCQAAGGFAGDPDRQRQGSFADSDRVVTGGHAVVLVDISEIVASEARPQLERDARAA